MAIVEKERERERESEKRKGTRTIEDFRGRYAAQLFFADSSSLRTEITT